MSDYQSLSVTALRDALIPQYIEHIPDRDGWKSTYQYYLNVTTPSSQRVMAIGSGGRDKSVLEDSYTAEPFDPTDYDQDVVWADGFFVRWPQK
jgi:hypothetical protein